MRIERCSWWAVLGAVALAGCAGGEAVSTGGAATLITTAAGSTGEAMSTGDASTGSTTRAEETSTGEEETGVGEGGCAEGTPDCPCYGNLTCNDGLVCEAALCVPAVAAVCGDGQLGGTEACDAGADNDDAALCKTDCTMQRCGDGSLGVGEACDDGNMVDDDECSNTCVPAACGDLVMQVGEACDDGNLDVSDACVACQAAICGDTFVHVGVEECDDGNAIDGDGCSALCMKEAPKCGGNFTTDWCPQAGTKEQSTRCESVGNGGKTCNNPFIKYGTRENGVPGSNGGNDFALWCTQLGFAGFSGQVSYGSRACDAPQGRLFGCMNYDEPGWHWCDNQDGFWWNQTLDNYSCNDGQEITSITCL